MALSVKHLQSVSSSGQVPSSPVESHKQTCVLALERQADTGHRIGLGGQT